MIPLSSSTASPPGPIHRVRPASLSPVLTILLSVLRVCAISMASLYVGYNKGMADASIMFISHSHRNELAYNNGSDIDMQAPEYTRNNCPKVTCPPLPAVTTVTCPPIPTVTCPPLPPVTTTTCPPIAISKPPTSTSLFGNSTQDYVQGMSLVDRDDFAAKFDVGVPVSKSDHVNNQVLLLHGSKSMPANSSLKHMNHLSVDDATQNCNYLSLILTQPGRLDQCIAIMGQYNSYHVHKSMRLKGVKRVAIDESKPLQLVKRSAAIEPFHTRLPPLSATKKYWETSLQPYLQRYKEYLDKLRPITKEIGKKHNNIIIVMVCNHGQSELLVNFVCSAKARGHDISGILVFSTDKETEEISKNLGLATFYDENLFGDVPKKFAEEFGDATYERTILPKVHCVHLVGMLGYDYLFQDVDIVWYRHPIDYFGQLQSLSSFDKDIYMQDDGSHSPMYAPYAGNTGFYYVRNNERTQHFMNQFLVSGDLILLTGTHQAPFITVLSEHASAHGLKVKILPGQEFPGGHYYQMGHSYMKRLLNVTAQPSNEPGLDPWIFHMSWSNKVGKVKYLEQMGLWFVKQKCMSNETRVVPKDSSATADENTAMIQRCCAAKPIIKCHFHDKPSIIPCNDSPAEKKNQYFFHPNKKH
jgi:Nucleotide-diphospho-sugar transferase